ncbi:hypothetical protein MRX96_026683 [Rhipicephalus microplus]
MTASVVLAAEAAEMIRKDREVVGSSSVYAAGGPATSTNDRSPFTNDTCDDVSDKCDNVSNKCDYVSDTRVDAAFNTGYNHHHDIDYYRQSHTNRRDNCGHHYDSYFINSLMTKIPLPPGSILCTITRGFKKITYTFPPDGLCAIITFDSLYDAGQTLAPPYKEDFNYFIETSKKYKVSEFGIGIKQE